MKHYLLIGTSIFLIGCGGSSSSPTEAPQGTETPTIPPLQTDPANMIEALDSLADAFSSPIVYSPLQNIPTTGTATYDGYFFVELSNGSDSLPDELIANLRLQVSFNPNNVSAGGSASNFFDENQDTLSGEVTLTSSNLDRTGNPNSDATFTASMSGNLSPKTGSDFGIAARLEGDFLGASHDALGGAVFGRATQDGELQDVDGRFIAAR